MDMVFHYLMILMAAVPLRFIECVTSSRFFQPQPVLGAGRLESVLPANSEREVEAITHVACVR